MKEINLGGGVFTMVDDIDFEWLSNYVWRVRGTGIHLYAFRKTLHGTESMHRLLLDASKGVLVDHIDRNTLNNQRSNLRICSASGNARNRSNYIENKFKGVRKVSSGNRVKYRSYIGVDGIKRHLGVFISEIDAAIAYNRAAVDFHGEFASLNPVFDDGRKLNLDARINSSKFKGVNVGRNGKIRAFITIKRKQIYLGSFKTEEDAALVFDKEARTVGYPEHKLNFPSK